jgi:hypothetical protein
MSTALIEKADLNPLWDGDGLQGAGQPRDRLGRWIKLPGPSHLKSIGAWELEDGSFGVFVNREQEPRRIYRRKFDANGAIATAIKTDARLYAQKEENKRLKVVMRGRPEEERRSQAQVAAAAPRQSGAGLVPTKGRAAKKPGVHTKKIEVSETEAFAVPGRPTIAQTDAANAWARQNMKPEEAKYAGLITRLLRNKGITQNPRVRGTMAQRYGITPKRLAEIERDVYDHMFPQKAAGAQKPINIQGAGQHVSSAQLKSIKEHGGRKAVSLASPENVFRPEIQFKANKGEHRGKWLKLSYNGVPEVIDEDTAAQNAIDSKVFWSNYLARNKEFQAKMRDKRRLEQQHLQENADESAQNLKEWKIRQAQKWAKDQGFDPDDSYWWGFYWNEPALIKGGESQEGEVGEGYRATEINLAEAMERAKMDPSLLEGILSIPDDFDTKKMRGHRPGSKRALKDDEDFEEASPESRKGDTEWESRNLDRQIRFERRITIAYQKYKQKNPKSKITLAEFTDWYYNNKMRIPGGKRVSKSRHPRWDGDGVQPPGQRRDRSGRWSDQSSALGAIERVMRQSAVPGRRASLAPSARVAGIWDHKNKTLKPGTKLTRLPHQGLEAPLGPNGKPLAKKKYSAEQALYLRNNGPTKISDKRLGEIYDSMFRKGSDAKPPTQQELDLLMSAGAREAQDGANPIRVWTVRQAKFLPKTRFFLMNTIRKETANRAHKGQGSTVKGDRGHVVRRHDIDTTKKAAENAKRVASGRNMVRAPQLRQLMEDFGDGHKANCIFCGKPVDIDSVSVERMKPGPINGKYERGNMAPSHLACNTKVGHKANSDPHGYYDDMMRKFLMRYKGKINKGELGFVFTKHRGKLAGKRVTKR